MTSRGTKTEMVTVRMSAADKAKLKEMAAASERTASQQVVFLIKQAASSPAGSVSTLGA